MHIEDVIKELQLIANREGNIMFKAADWGYMRLRPVEYVSVVNQQGKRVAVATDVDPSEVDWA